MSKILIGTTSWTDKSLIESGRFYPSNVKTAEARLRFYAKQFPVVEVDSSYYGMPSERNSMLWAERTPTRFVFDMKVFRLFTQHQTPPSALPAAIRTAVPNMAGKRNLYYKDLPEDQVRELWVRFRSAVEPLRKTGKLGVILFQFPPWFVYRPSHLEYIAHCAEMLEGCQLAIEFRHKSWLSTKHLEAVLKFARSRSLVYVIVDEPQGFDSSVPAVWEATSKDVAIVRLHGRNRQTWMKKGLSSSAERFNYLYSPTELREFLEPIRQLSTKVRRIHVLFNNCYRDNAQRNAVQLQQLLDSGE